MAKHFSVDARTILNLGRESIRDHATAVTELVKNSFDADATRVDIDLSVAQSDSPESFIRIRDNGSGMTESDVDEKWLRIGFSEKRSIKVSPRFGRRTTGEKGIGRISADRLGATLDLVTCAPNSKPFGLHINWAEFESSDIELEKVPLQTVRKPSFQHELEINRLKQSGIAPWSDLGIGTELTARGLRHSWTIDDIEKLRRELSIFISPFSEINNFSINLVNDIEPSLSGPISTSLPESAAIEIDAAFDGTETVTYTISNTLGAKELSPPKTVTWAEITQRQSNTRRKHGATQLELAGTRTTFTQLGPIRVRLLFYPRKQETTVIAKISLEGLKEFLNENSGIKIYRDGIRVKPYGDSLEPEGDWLQLGDRKARDPAGASRVTFKVAPNQIVGAVFASRDDNPKLTDSAAREGLIHNDAFRDLRSLTLGCITLLEAKYHELYTSTADVPPPPKNPTQEVATLSSRLTNLAGELEAAKERLPAKSSKEVERSAEHISEAIKAIQETTKSIESLASQATIFRGLATTGIAATVFGHETQSSISQVASSLQASTLLLESDPPEVGDALSELQKASIYSNRVASWGAFALSRVQRDKRRRKTHDIRALTEELLLEFTPVLAASDIEMRSSLEDTRGRTFGMDVESVLINLITNSYSACLQVQHKRVISVALRNKSSKAKNGFEITVSDSGPGVASEFRERIWDPLFTTKTGPEGRQVGTGLGLSIIQSIVEEMNGERQVDRDPQLKGARFKIWLPLG